MKNSDFRMKKGGTRTVLASFGKCVADPKFCILNSSIVIRGKR
jgi:hypothetical protein